MNSPPPKDAFQIETTARMWKWTFKYNNGQMLDTLVIPAGKPVSLNMTALDVIHSIYIPAFRLKKDIVPGTPRNAWFIANSPGEYDLFCTEYCGLEHSSMITSVKVLSQEDFDTWYANTKSSETESIEKKEVSPAMLGKQVVQRIGCNACHSTDGTKIVGPSYKGVFGHDVTVVTNGKERTIKADEDYIRRSILDPNADIVKGFNKGLMLSYKDQVTEEQIELIIEYIKSLQ
jgi:cytochrome c oxidase subunit 2